MKLICQSSNSWAIYFPCILYCMGNKNTVKLYVLLPYDKKSFVYDFLSQKDCAIFTPWKSNS